MKKYILKNMFFGAIIGIILFLIPFHLLAKNSETINSDSLFYSPNEIIIQFKNNFNLDRRYREKFKNSGNALLDSLNSLFRLSKILSLSPKNGFSSLTKIQNKLRHTYLFQFDEKKQTQELLKHYQALKITQITEPNYYYFLDGQKKLNISSDDKIQLDRAAQLIRHHTPVIIGIIDTGVDWSRKDMVAHVWQNPVEKMDNKDNDGNGFVDDIRGYDFTLFNSSLNLGKNKSIDSDGHGTYLSAAIDRIINYSTDVKNADVNKLMILKAAEKNLGGKTVFNAFSVSQAIIYAANNGANIVNFSACGKKPSQILKQAIDYAVNNSCTIIAAAGDENGSTPVYPAAFDNVISVAATDFNDRKTRSSNFGHWIDIAAPGYFFDQISDTTNAAISGTAVATAQVTGLAALLLSTENKISSDSLKKRIIFNVLL